MAQVPGLGLDQSQLADVINQQYKGYSQKQRNQMMQSAATTPDNWGAITQQANKTATQPTEFLGAGRTDNIPTVSKDGVQWTGYDDAGLQRLYGMNQNYNPVTSRWTEQVKNPKHVAPDPYAVNKDDPDNLWYGSTYLNQLLLEPEYLQVQREQRTPVSTDYTDSVGKKYYSPETINKIESSAPNFVSGWFGAYNNPSGNYQEHRPINAGGYYFADPWGFSHSLSKAGNNKYFVSENTLNEHTRSGTADTWYSLNPNADLSGLQYGQFQGQTGLFFDPTKTNLSSLLTPGRNNSAYADPGHGFFGDFGKIVEPVGNILGAIYSSGVPWGSILVGVDNAASGNEKAAKGNIINGLVSYGGSNVGSGGVMGSDVSLGSAAANSAANNMIINAGANYARTGDLENALKAAAFSTASGAAGNWLGSATASGLGEIGSKALGGAASAGLNSLFTKNSPIEGSLFGAMSGGLHGFLNSTDRSNNTYNKQQDTKNRQTAQAATKLAKLFTKK